TGARWSATCTMPGLSPRCSPSAWPGVARWRCAARSPAAPGWNRCDRITGPRCLQLGDYTPLRSTVRLGTPADRSSDLGARPLTQDHAPGPPIAPPVERGQVDGLDDAQVTQGAVQPLRGQGAQLAAGEAGAAERLQAVAVGPIDGAENVGAVARAADGNQHV